MMANSRDEKIPDRSVLLSGAMTEATAVKSGDYVVLRVQGMGNVSVRFV
jgi:2-keto-4-pentenoate hydratase